MIRILLADDHALVRDGIKSILERKGKNISVVAEMGNGKEMLDYAVKNKNIDVYVVDIAMPILNGIAAVQKLLKINPDAKVIVLSMYDDRASVEKAFKAGARGFVVKVSSADEIIEAIKEVSAGRFYLCSKVSKFVVQGFFGEGVPFQERPQRFNT